MQQTLARSPPKVASMDTVAKRFRSGSISSRLRSASELIDDGIIEPRQKGVLKDLIISGDARTAEALARYERGESAEALQNLLRENQGRSTADLLGDVGDLSLDFMSVSNTTAGGSASAPSSAPGTVSSHHTQQHHDNPHLFELDDFDNDVEVRDVSAFLRSPSLIPFAPAGGMKGSANTSLVSPRPAFGDATSGAMQGNRRRLASTSSALHLVTPTLSAMPSPGILQASRTRSNSLLPPPLGSSTHSAMTPPIMNQSMYFALDDGLDGNVNGAQNSDDEPGSVGHNKDGSVASATTTIPIGGAAHARSNPPPAYGAPAATSRAAISSSQSTSLNESNPHRALRLHSSSLDFGLLQVHESPTTMGRSLLDLDPGMLMSLGSAAYPSNTLGTIDRVTFRDMESDPHAGLIPPQGGVLDTLSRSVLGSSSATTKKSPAPKYSGSTKKLTQVQQASALQQQQLQHQHLHSMTASMPMSIPPPRSKSPLNPTSMTSKKAQAAAVANFGGMVRKDDVFMLNASNASATSGNPPPPVTYISLEERVAQKRAMGVVMVGAYSPESRRMRVDRFVHKRDRRVWKKKVKYDVRKLFADSRLRVKGRFVKKEDEELLRDLLTMC